MLTDNAIIILRCRLSRNSTISVSTNVNTQAGDYKPFKSIKHDTISSRSLWSESIRKSLDDVFLLPKVCFKTHQCIVLPQRHSQLRSVSSVGVCGMVLKFG